MINNHKYSCASELGAEILMAFTSSIIAISVVCLFCLEHPLTGVPDLPVHFCGKSVSLFLTSAYALLLPLMSYMFSQAKQSNFEVRAQNILIWMVLIEIIRTSGEPTIFTWGLQKSAERLVRLLWVGFLVCTYTPHHRIRASLIVLCVYGVIFEVLKGICFNMAKDSNLMEKNTKVIHNYMKKIMLQNHLQTTPMSSCSYIVVGEEDHEITVCDDGYILGDKKLNSGGILTVGRVFQFNSPEDEAFTSKDPNWRDRCLSLALSKILRRRFLKLPLDEARRSKALDFVLEGLIDYIGNNRDINQTDGRNGEVIFPFMINRVFRIIKVELKFISHYIHFNVVPHLRLFYMVDLLGLCLVVVSAMYLVSISDKMRSAWQSLVMQDAYGSCFFHILRRGSVVVKISSNLDGFITLLLTVACYYSNVVMFLRRSSVTLLWFNVWHTSNYIKNPAEWYEYYRSSETSVLTRLRNGLRLRIRKNELKAQRKNDKKVRYYSSVLDMEVPNILCCIKVHWSIIVHLPMWISNRIPRMTLTMYQSTDSKEAILDSLRKSRGKLTNGETSLRNNGMEHLNWACWPKGIATEAILVWHIATTLFHHHESLSEQNNNPHQEPEIQANTDFRKEQKVALELSSYCHYLVAHFPELLPDEVEWTKDMFERVIKDILAIDRTIGQKPTKKNRCIELLDKWGESSVEVGISSVVEKGTRLAKDLINCAENGKPVWKMLAEFWAEMMLFIAPSDNVEGHAKILHREELITQLWALLMHAGILTRPKPTEHHDHEREQENNEIP